ncbi:unnamed protein product [Lampetra planeri]
MPRGGGGGGRVNGLLLLVWRWGILSRGVAVPPPPPSARTDLCSAVCATQGNGAKWRQRFLLAAAVNRRAHTQRRVTE